MTLQTIQLTSRGNPAGTRACWRSGGPEKVCIRPLRKVWTRHGKSYTARSLVSRDEKAHPPIHHTYTSGLPAYLSSKFMTTYGSHCPKGTPSAGRRRGMTPLKGTNGLPTARHIVYHAYPSAGSPTGRELYGDGASIVVGGSMVWSMTVQSRPSHGGRESRPQGEGKQVSGLVRPRRYAQCRVPMSS